MLLLQRFLLRLIVSGVYYIQSRKGWSLLSDGPDCFNIAMPEFSASYSVATFRKKDKIILHGQSPECVYASMTVYDTQGRVVSHRRLTPNSTFVFVMGKDMALPTSYVYGVIFRVYQPNRAWELPSIIQNGTEIPTLSWRAIRERSHAMTGTVQLLLSFALKRKIFPGTVMVPTELEGYFPNPDAFYIVATPKTKTGVVIVEGTLPPRTSTTFMGFMTCNLCYTSTDMCLTWNDVPSQYKIYAAHSKDAAKEVGWVEGNHPLLLWNEDNKARIFVIRIIADKQEDVNASMPEITFC